MPRYFVRPVLAALLSIGFAACEGPMGPAGSPGPGTRLVLNGTVDQFGEAVIDLPAEAGTIDSPPAVTCYLSEIGQEWFIVSLDSDSDTDVETDTDFFGFSACLLGQSTGGSLSVVLIGVPPTWLFRVVVIY
jgi:hypothetical protein